MTFEQLFSLQQEIIDAIPHELRPGSVPSVVAALGLYEEVAEILDVVSWKVWRQNKWDKTKLVEELSDALHYITELCILNGVSAADLSEGYCRKHDVNLERYRKADMGDFSFDTKKAGEL